MERQKFGNRLPKKMPLNGPKTNLNRKKPHPAAPQKPKVGREQSFNHFDSIPDDSSSLSRPQGTSNPVRGDAQSGYGAMGSSSLGAGRRISISLDFKSKRELRDIRSKLVSELSLVRNLVKRIENYSSSSNSKFPVNSFGGDHSGKLKRVRSEVGSVDFSQGRPQDQLGTSGVENSQGVNSNFGKGPKKPKTNLYYQNQDPTVGKEKILTGDHKKPKTNVKKSGGGEGSSSNFRMGNSSSKVFKTCNTLLDKLMKHRNGWIFSSPVDVEGLGLHDYYTIIKHPMDLGTVKSRLNSNWYKTPEDFAEDVRLTFRNALRYNPEGHEINTFAGQLLKMFEDKWAAVAGEYLHETNVASDYQEVHPNPVPRAPPPPAPSPVHPPPDMNTTVDKLETVPNPNPADPEPKVTSSVQSGRGRVPKKPKARDPNKRDMTFEEKQKLSTSLQSLPSEKLETVLQIIKKRNPHLCQSDEEIEVDIDNVDTETLWELDRFVINYKKNLSKIRRSAELAQIGIGPGPNMEEENEAHSVMEEPTENKSDEKNVFSSSPAQVQAQGEAEGRSASVSNGSSSSSSDSASSSSDSDTDSSSS